MQTDSVHLIHILHHILTYLASMFICWWTAVVAYCIDELSVPLNRVLMIRSYFVMVVCLFWFVQKYYWMGLSGRHHKKGCWLHRCGISCFNRWLQTKSAAAGCHCHCVAGHLCKKCRHVKGVANCTKEMHLCGRTGIIVCNARAVNVKPNHVWQRCSSGKLSPVTFCTWCIKTCVSSED